MARKFTVALIVFLFSFLTAAAYAVQEKVDLRGEALKGANGEALIKDAGEGGKMIDIKARGLAPGSVYTVWFVKDMPGGEIAGIGRGDHSFRSDAAGNGEFSALVPEKDIADWDNIEVFIHPDGDPGNVRNAGIALKGDISEADSYPGP